VSVSDDPRVQLRRPRSRDHLMVLPGWRDHDRAVAIASLSMTLVGVGSVLPGLPTLLTNLIHQVRDMAARRCTLLDCPGSVSFILVHTTDVDADAHDMQGTKSNARSSNARRRFIARFGTLRQPQLTGEGTFASGMLVHVSRL
jgi:hypothetical protein